MSAKRLLIAAGLLISVGYQSQGYAYYSSIVVGPNLSNASINATALASMGGSNPAWGVGYSFGSFLGFDFTNQVGMEFGVLYSRRVTSVTTVLGSTNVNISTLDVPILLSFAPIASATGFKIEVGPYFGLLPSASVTYQGNTIASGSNTDSIDVGLVGGLTYIGKLNDNVGLRVSAFYNHGLTDMSSNTSEVYTRSFTLYAGVVLYR